MDLALLEESETTFDGKRQRGFLVFNGQNSAMGAW